MRRLHFSKYSACGNDFIMVDNRDDGWTEVMTPALIERLCHRRFGVGADGLILLCKSSAAPIRMRYFNADGSEGEVPQGPCASCSLTDYLQDVRQRHPLPHDVCTPTWCSL